MEKSLNSLSKANGARNSPIAYLPAQQRYLLSTLE